MIKPQTLDEGEDGKFFKMFGVSDAKIGKTTTFACSVLGALPDQTYGLVTDPPCLHIISFDDDAVNGLKSFLVDQCKRPDCTKLTHWDMTKMAREAILGDGYDATIINNINAVLQEIDKRAAADKKIHAVLFSSFTGMGMALKAGLAGKPRADSNGQIKSSGMDRNKWDILNAELMTVRANAHNPTKHVFWEGHVQDKFVTPVNGEVLKGTTTEETVGVPGGEGRNWAANVAEVTRLRREAVKYKDTKIDKVSFDTRPNADFISGGRGFITHLEPKEYDIALMGTKLGKAVGGYKKP